jgi:hypothetical protein
MRTSAKLGTGLCPVYAFAGLVSRILAYKLGTSQWEEVAVQPMNLVAMGETGTRATKITAGEVLVHLRAAPAIQYAWGGTTGFLASCCIGTHSLKAGAAMAILETITGDDTLIVGCSM